MKIHEVEQKIGIKSANIRYYEKVGLLAPERNKGNGYRKYTEHDLMQLERIKTLRLINISVDDIKLLFEGGISMKEVMTKRLNELDQEEQKMKENRDICIQILKNELALDQLDSKIFETNKNTWNNRLKAIQKTDVDKHLLVKGCCLMFGIALLVYAAIPAWDYMMGIEPVTLWILPYIGYLFFAYSFVLLLIEAKKDLPFLYAVGKDWKAPGLGILSNSFSFAGLGIGMASKTILQFILYFAVCSLISCSVRLVFMCRQKSQF